MNSKSGTFWGIVTIMFLGFIGIGVLRNAKGFSAAAGTLFTGTNTLGRTLEGR
jgi:hypothetical protein